MRSFFSFKSSSPRIPPSSDPPDPDHEKTYWEKPSGNDVKLPHRTRTSDGSEAVKEDEDSSDMNHRRSASFSSPDMHTDFGCRTLTPEREFRANRGDLGTVRQSHAAENLNSPGAFSTHNCSSGNSAYSSPISLRCRASRLQQGSKRTLDLYINGEDHEIDSSKAYTKNVYEEKGHSVENKGFSCTGRSPRAFSTAPSSPTYSRHNLQIVKEANVRPTSSMYHSKMKLEQILRSLHDRSSQYYDSETITTAEDINDDSSNQGLTTNSTTTSQHNFNDFGAVEDIYPCDLDSKSLHSLQKLNTDEELIKKVKEVKHMLNTFSNEDYELENLHTADLNVPTLLQTIRSIMNDRRYIAIKLISQIKSQIAERACARERLKQAKFELATRTMRLEKEKTELQSSLEEELDRRSSDWSLKLEKIQVEEQRLRERVRELAEQNVSLQRENSALKGNEAGTRNRIMNSESQLKDLAASLDIERTEKHNLHQALTEIQERLNETEEERNSMQQSLKEKEKESMELQKVVIRFGKLCSEKDKTIDGLREGYANEIGKQSIEKDGLVSMLQREQLRLIGVEQTLRKELESSYDDLKSLRRENMCLLDRLQGTKTGNVLSSVKLDEEFRVRVDCLQNQGLSLLDDHSKLIGKMLDLIKSKQYESVQEEKHFHDYSVGEYTAKYQSLRKGTENFRRSLSKILEILDQKSELDVLECHLRTTQGGRPRQSEVDLEMGLKAETLLTGVLREKLYSKELETEVLQSELAYSIQAHEILKSEVQRLQDELSCLTHMTKDMELQILRRDKSNEQLQRDFQECRKNLTSDRGTLKNISKERDQMWEELNRSKETIMLLNLELGELKKKNEALEDDVLVKEGEITILKDSMTRRPFDAIYSPKSLDFSRE